jgi:hypothetical protein
MVLSIVLSSSPNAYTHRHTVVINDNMLLN